MPQTSVPIGVNKHLIIDGQQRLTTLAVLLCSLRAYDEEDKGRIEEYLVNRHESDYERLKLLPTDGDRRVYQKLVLESAPPPESHRIGSAYSFFLKRLRTTKDSVDLSVEGNRMLRTIERCLQVVMINLSETDDPYSIFDSLNSKGAPLTQADLIRNYMLMRFQISIRRRGARR